MLFVGCALLLVSTCNCLAKYEPTWESLDSRPIPQWYDDGKIGIMIHWGVFSVPSQLNEWFWHNWKSSKVNSTVEYMKANFKPNFTYADFGPMFTAEFFYPDQWADLFQKAGAKYIVLTAKHHEGYTMWPSKFSFSWNAMDVGPKRDLVDELAKSIRNRTDIKFGLYHSLFEFYHPLWLEDVANNFRTNNFVKMKTMPELYELTNIYKPELLWSDGDWMVDDSYFESRNFLTWLYNDSPVKDTVVVNDRWGKNARCRHGGYWTCHDRYNPGVLQKNKWENIQTIDKKTAGFNRQSDLSHYFTMEEMMFQLVTTISCGGNLLLNVGPTHDGRIVPIFEERLLSLGQWLEVNGESIYESKPWTYQNDTDNPDVWYTMKPGPAVYAITLKWPASGVLALGAPVPSQDTTAVQLLGYQGLIPWSVREEGGMNLDIPVIPFNKMPCQWAWVFKITGLKSYETRKSGDTVVRFKPQH